MTEDVFLASNSSKGVIRAIVLCMCLIPSLHQVWSTDQQQWYPLGARWKCRTLDSSSDLLNQNMHLSKMQF